MASGDGSLLPAAQVRNGKGSMPAWADSLSPQDIQDVAAYVYNQADKELW